MSQHRTIEERVAAIEEKVGITTAPSPAPWPDEETVGRATVAIKSLNPLTPSRTIAEYALRAAAPERASLLAEVETLRAKLAAALDGEGNAWDYWWRNSESQARRAEKAEAKLAEVTRERDEAWKTVVSERESRTALWTEKNDELRKALDAERAAHAETKRALEEKTEQNANNLRRLGDATQYLDGAKVPKAHGVAELTVAGRVHELISDRDALRASLAAAEARATKAEGEVQALRAEADGLRRGSQFQAGQLRDVAAESDKRHAAWVDAESRAVAAEQAVAWERNNYTEAFNRAEAAEKERDAARARVAELEEVERAARAWRTAEIDHQQADAARSKKFCDDGKPRDPNAHAEWLRRNADLIETQLAAAVRAHEAGKMLDRALAAGGTHG